LEVISLKKKKENSNASGLKIIPLGGLEQIGMNITAFQYEDSIIVVDCGLSFPADDMLGIDLVIPDVTYLKDNIDKVKGFVITHGHEDHIGALPYVLRDINVPIYATRLTMGMTNPFTLSILSFRYVTSGMTRSIPSISSAGKDNPQSTTIILSSYWKAVMFIPICSRPPKGMIFRPEALLFSFFFFNEITSKFYTSIQLFLVYVSRR
jgi:hypothetical protein